jgi:hypothetical protein
MLYIFNTVFLLFIDFLNHLIVDLAQLLAQKISIAYIYINTPSRLGMY